MSKYSKVTYLKYDQKMQKILDSLKINGCSICGYNKCSRALNFHHINPENKLFQISRKNIRTKSSDLIIKELQKCVLLCCNCHMEIENVE